MAGSNDTIDSCRQLLAEHQVMKVAVCENNIRVDTHLQRFAEHLAAEERSFTALQDRVSKVTQTVQGIQMDLAGVRRDMQDETRKNISEVKTQLTEKMSGHVSKNEVKFVWFVVTTLLGGALWMWSNIPAKESAAQKKRIQETERLLLNELRQLKKNRDE